MGQDKQLAAAITKIEQQINQLMDKLHTLQQAAKIVAGGGEKRQYSAEALANISAAQRKRWEKHRARKVVRNKSSSVRQILKRHLATNNPPPTQEGAA